MHTASAVIDAINKAERIAVAAHVRPDGDAVGATLGLCRILKGQGKFVSAIGLEPVPDRYRFLIADDRFEAIERVSAQDYDLLVVLDTGSLDRAPDGLGAWFGSIRTLNIDHHPTNTGFADINFVDERASSVGEMICMLAHEAGMSIPGAAAEALWVALITDTGRFAYSNTREATLLAAAVLLKRGVDTARIDELVYNRATEGQVRLQGRAIEHLEMYEQGRCALVSLSREDFAAFNCRGQDADEIVNIPRRVTGVDVAIFLYEQLGDGARETKVSLRTADPYDAATLCRDLGGGGHARAAGCTLAMPLADARAHILDVIHNVWFATAS